MLGRTGIEPLRAWLFLDLAADGGSIASKDDRNGIDPTRASELDCLANGFVMETEPSFPALDLVSALAGRIGVEFSSLYWRKERSAK